MHASWRGTTCECTADRQAWSVSCSLYTTQHVTMQGIPMVPALVFFSPLLGEQEPADGICSNSCADRLFDQISSVAACPACSRVVREDGLHHFMLQDLVATQQRDCQSRCYLQESCPGMLRSPTSGQCALHQSALVVLLARRNSAAELSEQMVSQVASSLLCWSLS